MKFYAFVALIYLMIAIGLYAIQTGQTAGQMCRGTGRGIAHLARATAGTDGAMNGIAQGVEAIGRSMEDGCTRR